MNHDAVVGLHRTKVSALTTRTDVPSLVPHICESSILRGSAELKEVEGALEGDSWRETEERRGSVEAAKPKRGG